LTYESGFSHVNLGYIFLAINLGGEKKEKEEKSELKGGDLY
jgi:hypothetical protein